MSFTEISVIFFTASIFAILAKTIKQPLLIGYIFAGLLLGALGLSGNIHSFESLSQLGIALLLFLLGLEMNLSEVHLIGKVAFITGVTQILVTTFFCFILSTLFGFDRLPSLYIAAALSFSSTIIVIKLLSEKKDLNSLYGKISIGFLLVQDLFAILILIFLSGLKAGTNPDFMNFATLFLRAIVLLVLVWILAKKIFPIFIEKYVAGSGELLFVTSIAWALGFAAFVAGPMGFSVEIGGFLAGLSLSTLPEHYQIASKTKPLRDFFLIIFFLLLGSKLVISSASLLLMPTALVLSFYVLVSHTVILFVILGFLGFRKRTSFLVGLTVAQISEFSIILVAIGLSLGHITGPIVSLITMVGIITMTISTYLILGSENLYERFKHKLSIFERKFPKELSIPMHFELENHIVLVGCDRTGKSILSYLVRKNLKIVVIDFNPSVYSKLCEQKIPVILGDVNDSDVADFASIREAGLVISTIGNFNDNIRLLAELDSQKQTVVIVASTRSEALRLYERGASYVIVPEFLAGEHLKHLLIHFKGFYAKFKKIGRRQHEKLING